jgi:hypothetical protein
MKTLLALVALAFACSCSSDKPAPTPVVDASVKDATAVDSTIVTYDDASVTVTIEDAGSDSAPDAK